MKDHNVYKCRIEKSKINGNYTIWLPEQDDNNFVDAIANEYNLSQGILWELLLKVAAKDSGLDISSVYFEPEGDVFVAYTSNYELSKNMESLLNILISKHEYLVYIVNQSSLKNN